MYVYVAQMLAVIRRASYHATSSCTLAAKIRYPGNCPADREIGTRRQLPLNAALQFKPRPKTNASVWIKCFIRGLALSLLASILLSRSYAALRTFIIVIATIIIILVTVLLTLELLIISFRVLFNKSRNQFFQYR